MSSSAFSSDLPISDVSAPPSVETPAMGREPLAIAPEVKASLRLLLVDHSYWTWRRGD
jgi:hypothetical protein